MNAKWLKVAGIWFVWSKKDWFRDWERERERELQIKKVIYTWEKMFRSKIKYRKGLKKIQDSNEIAVKIDVRAKLISLASREDM